MWMSGLSALPPSTGVVAAQAAFDQMVFWAARDRIDLPGERTDGPDGHGE
jgi:hypothetical protein